MAFVHLLDVVHVRNHLHLLVEVVIVGHASWGLLPVWVSWLVSWLLVTVALRTGAIIGEGRFDLIHGLVILSGSHIVCGYT